MKSKALIGGIIALVVLVAAVIFCLWAGGRINDTLSTLNPTDQSPDNGGGSGSQPSDAAEEKEIYLALGNPGNASPNASNADNYLMINDFYAVSYNRSKAIPNWTAWRLTAADIGKTNRQNDFRPDERLPQNWLHVTPNDYSGSGFDRGHLCPSADRSNSAQANSATFLMTNMTPQLHDLNAGPWEKLETYARSLARRNSVLYIIAGSYGENGRLKNKVTIPTNFWKIVVVLSPNSTAINANSRIIAVDMPNINGISDKGWRDYKTTVRQLEQKTGYNFFSNQPQNLQDALETKADNRQNLMQ